MGKREQLDQLARLVNGQRWAALATVDETAQPMASMVGYVVNEEFDSVALHLSRLAAHTRNLLANPHASLVISACDDGSDDPQLLMRASLQGHVEIIERDIARITALHARLKITQQQEESWSNVAQAMLLLLIRGMFNNIYILC